ncbi:MAG: sulfatase-like hydrolase/transferase, partial [Eubacteriales bacterium]
MNKNLVIYHMESINNCMYQMQSKYFVNLNRLKQDMQYYEQYYSTATSTFMVTSDLLYGNTDIFEHVRTAKGIYLEKANEVSLLEELSNKNYDTQVLYYGNIDIDRKEKYYARLAPSSLMSIIDTSEEFIRTFTTSVGKSEPFAVFIEDNAGHISYDGKRGCNEISSGKKKYCNRINKIDEAIGSIFAILEEKNKLKDTIILLYGDHGDDMWMHGFNEGYAHALPPYNHMIHCPLFLYDATEEGTVIDTLIGTGKLKELSLNHLSANKQNISVEYCYSRNLLANQKENISILNKSYSVTDGEYTLLVTRKGLELYMNLLDPMNLTNYLDFYIFKNNNLYFKDYL